MRNQRLVILILLLLLPLLAGCEAGSSAADPEATAAPVEQQTENIVSATGEVRPARWANLSLPVGGTVNAVLVEEGQAVQAGQPLIELNAVALARTVAEAQAALAAAEADLTRVRAGAHPQDVAAAEQAVAAAQANVAMAQARIVAAEAESDGARTGVATANAQQAIAQAGVKVAQAELNRVQAGASPQDISAAGAALDKARAAVRQAQFEYDRVGGASNTPQALALEQATLDLQMAQARYDQLIAGPRPTDLAPLQAGVEAAQGQAALTRAQVAQAENLVAQAEAAKAQAQAAQQVAQAQLAQAQATVDRLRAGPMPEELAVAEAAVARAHEALATAQAMLDQATLVAPFDGTVGLVQVHQGEEVMPGQLALVLGDTGTLQVETTDLDEVDVARIQPGQRVDLTFDALPDKVLQGHVARVAPMATPGQGATTYRVLIEFDELDPALRWGMTAFADIAAK